MSVARGDPMEAFISAKTSLLDQHQKHTLSGTVSITASAEEEVVARILANIIAQDDALDPTENFMTNRFKYEESRIVEFFKEMPKGAHLHLHNFAAGSFKTFASILNETENLYVYTGASVEGGMDHGSFHFVKPGKKVPENFKATVDCSYDFIYKLITLPESFASKKEKKEYLKDRWTTFQACWGRIMNVVHAVPFYDGKDSYYYKILEEQYNAGVRYLELRTTAGEVYTDCYEPVSAKEYLLTVKKTNELFKKDHPGFLGCTIIFSSLKVQTNEEIHSDVMLTIALKKDKDVGDVVGGFDLVGHEDKLRPISDYVQELQLCVKNGVDLLLHAGETNDSNTYQMYDAIVLGTKRLGHAYDLVNHPILMKKVIDNDIAVECCPISNQGLGYVHDMRNHNAKTMIKHGVKVTISSDDPGMFHYVDVSYDFALACKSWGLSLLEMKKIVKQSFSSSTMTRVEVELAEQNFETDWQHFILKMQQKFKDYL